MRVKRDTVSDASRGLKTSQQHCQGHKAGCFKGGQRPHQMSAHQISAGTIAEMYLTSHMHYFQGLIQFP
jgi:hypothetical protein